MAISVYKMMMANCPWQMKKNCLESLEIPLPTTLEQGIWREWKSIARAAVFLGSFYTCHKGMLAKAISKLKPGKAAGPSCITVEMIKATDNQIIPVINLLIHQIITNRKIPEEWNLSFTQTVLKIQMMS